MFKTDTVDDLVIDPIDLGLEPKPPSPVQSTEELDVFLDKYARGIKDIAGVIVVNSDGVTVKSTLEMELSMQVIWKLLPKLLIVLISNCV